MEILLVNAQSKNGVKRNRKMKEGTTKKVHQRRANCSNRSEIYLNWVVCYVWYGAVCVAVYNIENKAREKRRVRKSKFAWSINVQCRVISQVFRASGCQMKMKCYTHTQALIHVRSHKRVS